MGLLTDIKFEVIKYVINKYQLKGMTTYLCNCIVISKSGYYNNFRYQWN